MDQRLGNQFFRYAYAKALQVKYYPNYPIIINFYHFKDKTPEERQQGFENSLKHFQLENVTYIEERPRKTKTWPQFLITTGRMLLLEKPIHMHYENVKLKYFDAKFIQPIANMFGLYNPITYSNYVAPRRALSRNIFCDAVSENAEYFRDIRDILVREFTPKYDVLPHNIELLRQIESSESVCVTIRRGDFLSEKYAPSFNVCGEEYFSAAMKAIRYEIPDCRFFIFSDDVDDVKRSIHFPFDVVYERGDDPVWEKIRLMYSCKHFIISNSTFSWWAQYLGRNEKKLVYAPVPWRWSGEDRKGMYLPYMKTIECNITRS